MKLQLKFKNGSKVKRVIVELKGVELVAELIYGNMRFVEALSEIMIEEDIVDFYLIGIEDIDLQDCRRKSKYEIKL